MPFKKIKEVLIKHAICTLDFMVGDLSTKDDLRKLIDVRQYEADIFGPGRIYDRMVRYPMEIQQISSQAQTELDLSNIKLGFNNKRTISQVNDREKADILSSNKEEELSTETADLEKEINEKSSLNIPKIRKI
ncbi:MAG: hypothetical protein ACW964_20670 [Candidatus Hodarchaeales archaeon]